MPYSAIPTFRNPQADLGFLKGGNPLLKILDPPLLWTHNWYCLATYASRNVIADIAHAKTYSNVICG